MPRKQVLGLEREFAGMCGIILVHAGDPYHP